MEQPDPDLKQIYHLYLRKLQDEKTSSTYAGKESFYHSSKAGLCLRKHFFGTTQQLKGREIDDATLRIFRMGTIVHEDIQNALRMYAEQEGIPIFIEKELFLEQYNVRGFIDLAYAHNDILYDIKTCNYFKWSKMFGRKTDENPSDNYELQLATYGLWYLQTYGKLSGMRIAYYNKNNSDMREVCVPMSYLSKAEDYWKRNYEATYKQKEPPPVKKGESPAYNWECNEKYCDYFDVCGGGIKGK